MILGERIVVQQQLGHAQHAGDGVPDLVHERCEVLADEPRRLDGSRLGGLDLSALLVRLAQSLLGDIEVGNIGRDNDDANDLNRAIDSSLGERSELFGRVLGQLWASLLSRARANLRDSGRRRS